MFSRIFFQPGKTIKLFCLLKKGKDYHYVIFYSKQLKRKSAEMEKIKVCRKLGSSLVFVKMVKEKCVYANLPILYVLVDFSYFHSALLFQD